MKHCTLKTGTNRNPVPEVIEPSQTRKGDKAIAQYKETVKSLKKFIFSASF
jgi:hypothetical protein